MLAFSLPLYLHMSHYVVSSYYVPLRALLLSLFLTLSHPVSLSLSLPVSLSFSVILFYLQRFLALFFSISHSFSLNHLLSLSESTIVLCFAEKA